MHWLVRIKAASSREQTSAFDFAALEEEGLEALQAYSHAAPERIPELLVRFVLPGCLDTAMEFERRVVRDRRRELLVRWTDELPDPLRSAALGAVYYELRLALAGESQEAACWTLAVLGQRDEIVVEQLWTITLSMSAARNLTLRTLCALGPVGDHYEQLLQLAHSRAAEGYCSDIHGALHRLADARSVPVIVEHWVRRSDIDNFERHSLFGLLGAIAVANRNFAELQDEIWRQIIATVEIIGETAWSAVLLGSNIAPRINSPDVILDITNWIIKDRRASEGWTHGHYLAALRLQECVLPRHLLGWKSVNRRALVSVLRSDALADTGNSGVGRTQEHWRKESIWELLLRSAVPEILAWTDEGVANETNPFLQGELFEVLSAFRLPSFPQVLQQLIEETYALSRQGNNSSRWAPVVGAVELAWSQSTRESFDVLAGCGFSVDGHGLRVVGDALADVAKDRINAGETDVVEELFHRLMLEQPLHQREAAARALAAVAELGELSVPAIRRLLQAAKEPGRDDFERGALISGLRHRWEQLSGEGLEAVVQWAEDAGRETSTRALELLADTGELRRHPLLLKSAVGLQHEGSGWRLGATAAGKTWAAYITGMLYEQEPDAFAPALADFLTQDDWFTPVQAANSLRYATIERGLVIQPIVIQALEERVRLGRWERMADPAALIDLAEFAPERLLAITRESDWREWIPAGREALAAAMGTMMLSDSAEDARRLEVLLALCGDGERSVRDAAYRAIVSIGPSLLLAHVYTWCISDSARLRICAAEASAWIDSPNPRLDEVAMRLAHDLDRRVRDTWAEAEQTRMRRADANEYLQRLVRVEGSNADILEAWPYGRALESVGEDEHINFLVTAFRERKVARNVRSWVSHMVKRVETDLKKRRKKQRDEPFIPSAATIHVGSGWMHIPNTEPQSIRYQLWLQAAPNPDQTHSWGGAVMFESEPDFWVSPGIKATVELSGGEKGRALLTLISGAYIALSGDGPFPSTSHSTFPK